VTQHWTRWETCCPRRQTSSDGVGRGGSPSPDRGLHAVVVVAAGAVAVLAVAVVAGGVAGRISGTEYISPWTRPRLSVGATPLSTVCHAWWRDIHLPSPHHPSPPLDAYARLSLPSTVRGRKSRAAYRQLGGIPTHAVEPCLRAHSSAWAHALRSEPILQGVCATAALISPCDGVQGP
jgi:hypothetical protein